MGNVLIDGERLGAKSQTLEDVLLRVPASEVLRIEILRGADVAGDASNAAVLANVVRTRTAGGGTWMAGFEMTNENKPNPTGRFAWSGRSEDREYSVGATTYGHDHNSEGPREVTDGDGRAGGESLRRLPARASRTRAQRPVFAGRSAAASWCSRARRPM